MSDAIPVRVMAPVHHVPPRARVARLSYAPVDIRTSLRSLGAGEHEPGPVIPMPGNRRVSTRIVDGALWRPVRKDDGNGKDPLKAVSAEDFRSWLSDSSQCEHLDTRDAARCFAGTPLVARLPHLQGMLRVRGGWDAAHVGEMLADARGRAARIGAAYLAESVALLSGQPHVRMRGPLCYLDATNGLRRIVRHPGTATTIAPAIHALPFRVGDGLAQAAFERAHPLASKYAVTEWQDEWTSGLFDGVDTDNDDDIDLFVADALRLLLENVDALRQAEVPHAPARLARLREASGLASVGLVEPQERADVLDLIVASAGEQAAAVNVFRQDKLARLVAFARDVAQPRLAARTPPDPDDVEALALAAAR